MSDNEDYEQYGYEQDGYEQHNSDDENGFAQNESNDEAQDENAGVADSSRMTFAQREQMQQTDVYASMANPRTGGEFFYKLEKTLKEQTTSDADGIIRDIKNWIVSNIFNDPNKMSMVKTLNAQYSAYAFMYKYGLSPKDNKDINCNTLTRYIKYFELNIF